ncbi:hypothetical protein KCQ_11210 [Pectobacterium atrosepticum ICMP 1526]|nr:hypothetical protein KCQ_11210 [Pectobacterium atrosepticum ICMP 1526]
MALTEAGEEPLLKIRPTAQAIATGFEDVAQWTEKS